jgi:hypothetical protein
MHDPQVLHDTLNTTTTVPADGAFSWHVDPSTRPFVGGGATFEDLKDVNPPVATFTGAPNTPTGTADHAFTLAPDQTADKVKVSLTATLPEDYDIEVFRKAADGSLTSVGTSGNPPGSPEQVVLDHPAAGDYVVRVAYFAAATGGYTVSVVRAVATRRVTDGHPEAYTLTCEDAAGTELERHDVIVGRGQQLTLHLGCGTGPSTAADGTPLPAAGTPVTAMPVTVRALAKGTARTNHTRAQKPASCRGTAQKGRRPARRRAALRSCARRYGSTRRPAR